MTRLLLLALTTLPLAAGCISKTEYSDVSHVAIEPGVTTKEELIQELGAPRGVRRQGTDTVLVFGFTEESGTGYGIGTFAISLGVQSTHSGVDTLEVVIGPDRKVRSYRLAQRPRETPVWPDDD